MHDYGNELQIQARLAYLSNHIEQMQWELARLSREAQLNNAGMTAIRKYLLNSDAQLQVQKAVADLLGQLDAQKDELEALAKTVTKLSRTQFKANTLSEAKDQQLAGTLNFLKELADHREDAAAEQRQDEQERLLEAQTRARGEVAADFLPILDGIDMALEHRPELPAARPEPQAPLVPRPPQAVLDPPAGFLHKIFHHEPKRAAPEAPPAEPQAAQAEQTLAEWHRAITGWLKGLEIVRHRFLTLLEYEGIERIPDVGSRFDPRLHVAIGTERRSDVADGVIVAVVRKGYRQRDRILRYAEVIVAQSAAVAAAAAVAETMVAEATVQPPAATEPHAEPAAADGARAESPAPSTPGEPQDAERAGDDDFTTFTDSPDELIETDENEQRVRGREDDVYG
jgi:molecular chaperone GrpE (heat shock protein)